MAKRNKQWLQTRARDPYVKQARQSKHRSRAVYKLMEIDERDGLFAPGQIVVDLGAAPGSWSQFASDRVGPQGMVIAVDMLIMEPLPKVLFIQGDFTDPMVYEKCKEELLKKPADLVISDMAPNLTGIRTTDQSRSMHLAEVVYDFSMKVLKPGGGMLVKLFQGAGSEHYKREVMERFQRVIVRKPRASRDNSREFYILAQGYVV